MDKILQKLLQGIIDYYQNLLKEEHRRFKKFNDDINNPYNVSDWLLDLSEKVNYDRLYDIENNIDKIFKFLGYSNDLKITINKTNRFDSDDPYCDTIVTTYCSHRIIILKNGYEVESDLAFTQVSGVNFEPMEFIPFMYKTMILYEADKLFDKYD